VTRAYYNENDAYAAAWLGNLISAGLIPHGDVDSRSIRDVQPGDLRGYTQAHFFAGIGGWSLALRLAGWPDERPVWTGSCPCQPFSHAGKRRGTADDRHLWPEFARLIRECGPATVLGEQVASADGRAWLADVRADLEGMGLAVGAADLCAASIGAPHIRQRLYWGAVRLADAAVPRRDAQPIGPAVAHGRPPPESGRLLPLGRLGDAGGSGLPPREREAVFGARGRSEGRAAQQSSGAPAFGLASRRDVRSPWADPEWLPCSDGKARPTQPGLFPLAHGVPGRVGKLRAYGNAIVPQLAAAFVQAFEASTRELMP
jgi:DNA (cytosine-5)-methyltransferase 1